MPKARLIASLKIWAVIYPSITAFLFLFGEHLSLLPLYIRTLVLTVSLVPWMVFIGLPLLELVIRRSAQVRNALKDLNNK
jgi:antibiotic biosynthesis monooxygenase (ABM) superfamily enzyme